MTSALNRLPDGNIEITINIPWEKIKTSFDQALAELAKKTTVKGFREGKAPSKKVEEQVGKNAVYEQVISKLIPEAYLGAVKEHGVRPIVNPKTELVAAEEGKDWQIKATTCELPLVKLGNYKEVIRKELAGEKIWTPGKDKEVPNEADKQKAETQRLNKIFALLIKSIGFEIPEMLLETEVNRRLSQLIDQTGRMGLTVDQYLSSTGKTADQIKAEYRKEAVETLKLELILATIADEEKINVPEAEIQKIIAGAPNEKAKKEMDTPEQRAYISQILRKRQVVDQLLKL